MEEYQVAFSLYHSLPSRKKCMNSTILAMFISSQLSSYVFVQATITKIP